MSKGYLIAIRDRLIDPEEMQQYTQKVSQTFTSPVKPIVAYGRAEAVEGDPIDGMVILEFESYEAAKNWYDSPAYQDAKTHRLKGADYRLIIAEGL